MAVDSVAYQVPGTGATTGDTAWPHHHTCLHVEPVGAEPSLHRLARPHLLLCLSRRQTRTLLPSAPLQAALPGVGRLALMPPSLLTPVPTGCTWMLRWAAPCRGMEPPRPTLSHAGVASGVKSTHFSANAKPPGSGPSCHSSFIFIHCSSAPPTGATHLSVPHQHECWASGSAWRAPAPPCCPWPWLHLTWHQDPLRDHVFHPPPDRSLPSQCQAVVSICEHPKYAR